MVLAHRERLDRRPTQRELSERAVPRRRRPAAAAAGPGVYARHNAVDTPALLPDGTPSELSVSQVAASRAASGPRAPTSRRRTDVEHDCEPAARCEADELDRRTVDATRTVSAP